MTIPFNPAAEPVSPFRIPDGYFDTLTERVMAHVPEQAPAVQLPRRSLWQVVRPYLSAAAVVAVVALGTKALQRAEPAAGYAAPTQFSVATAPSNALSDDLYSYLMLDDQSLYAFNDE
ncbi:MAG: hypothetical protein J6M53_03555 [Bacteroidaceae bacterium]|nr:hypothetical protein [Bacteroidaceae bacterium]